MSRGSRDNIFTRIVTRKHAVYVGMQKRCASHIKQNSTLP